ncbi:MAG: hypothetical protein EZS28_031814, partial [Streblomastix strix]
GRRRHNPGPGLFRQVMDSNNRDHKEERRLEEDPGLSNSEQRVGNGVFQIFIKHSITTEQQKRCDCIYVFYFNYHYYNYNGMPFGVQTAPKTFNKCIQPMIAEARERSSSRIFDYVDDILILNYDSTILKLEIQQVMKDLMEFCRMFAMDKSKINPTQIIEFLGWQWNTRTMTIQLTISRRRGVLKQLRHLMELAKRKKTIKNKGFSIRNFRNTIHNCTFETLRASYQITLKADRQCDRQKTLEQVDSTQQECDIIHNMVDQQTSPQSTIVRHETQQVDNNPDRSFELRMGATLIRENQEKVFAHKEQMNNCLKSSNQREVSALLKALLKFRQELIQQQPVGILLLTDKTVIMNCYNKDKGSISITPPVDKVLKQLVKVIQMRRLNNQERYPLENTQGIWDLGLHKRTCNTQEPIMRQILKNLQRQVFSQANRFSLESFMKVHVLHPSISKLLKTTRKVKKKRIPLVVLIAIDCPIRSDAQS